MSAENKTEKKKPNPIDIHVGSRIRLRRSMLGLSQTVLGDGLGITFQQIQKYEKGTNRVGASRLQDISSMLEVPVAFFFEGVPGKENVSSHKPKIDDLSKEYLDFMTTRQGVQLNRAFVQIKDPKIKAKTLQLVRAMANLDNSSDG